MRAASVRATISRLARRLRGRDDVRARAEAAELFAHLRINGSAEGLDRLALAASRGRWALNDLLDVLSRADAARARAAKRLEPHAARDLGIFLADLGRASEASTVLGAMLDVLGPRSIGKEGRFVLAELKVDAGETDDLPALLESLLIQRDDPAQAWLFQANAANPFRLTRGDEQHWLAAVNGMFDVEGLDPISIQAGEASPFDRIVSVPATTAEGPLVTVVIPTYAPDERLATAIESLLAQSYRSLQVLIMDDASPAQQASGLDAWRDRDPRIEVVHLPENNGPYLARNIAVAHHARGEYVTIHDDDDWSHPRKIERQVAHLESAPDIVANMCNGVRASDELWFGRVNGNPVWTQQALSSLMVRRSVFDEIGYWDVLNRSADAEFNDRIRSWTGGRIPVVGRVPLMLYRMRWGSLSDGEFRRGYMDPRRRWYFQAYRAWHDEHRARGTAPYVPLDNRRHREFSAPDDLKGSRADDACRRIEVDLAVVHDFRRADASTSLALKEIDEALDAGRRVAILHLDSPDVASGTPIAPRVLRLAMHDDVHVVALHDVVVASRAVIHDTSALDYLPRRRAAITASRVAVAVDADEDQIETCAAIFGMAPETFGDR